MSTYMKLHKCVIICVKAAYYSHKIQSLFWMKSGKWVIVKVLCNEIITDLLEAV